MPTMIFSRYWFVKYDGAACIPDLGGNTRYRGKHKQRQKQIDIHHNSVKFPNCWGSKYKYTPYNIGYKHNSNGNYHKLYEIDLQKKHYNWWIIKECRTTTRIKKTHKSPHHLSIYDDVSHQFLSSFPTRSYDIIKDTFPLSVCNIISKNQYRIALLVSSCSTCYYLAITAISNPISTCVAVSLVVTAVPSDDKVTSIQYKGDTISSTSTSTSRSDTDIPRDRINEELLIEAVSLMESAIQTNRILIASNESFYDKWKRQNYAMNRVLAACSKVLSKMKMLGKELLWIIFYWNKVILKHFFVRKVHAWLDS